VERVTGIGSLVIANGGYSIAILLVTRALRGPAAPLGYAVGGFGLLLAAALRPEAERLVEQLWRQKNDPAEVAEALRADQALSEPLRQAALRAVLRRALPPEAAPGNPRDPP
jgi:hypothetical protein